MPAKETTLQAVLNGLMNRYMERVPDVARILRDMAAEKLIDNPAGIENDHIAFRTIGVENLGIASLEKIFLHYGYQKMDKYYFPEKKLNAYWYKPENETDPRIFISELIVNDLPPTTAQLVKRYTDTVTADPVGSIDLNNAAEVDAFLHSGLWKLPSWEDYNELSAVSEYAAWTIYNRYYLNHFTISVHNLPQGYHTLERFNVFLEKHGYKLNNSAGKIKVSPDGGLLQSATVAQMISAPFSGGDEHFIPGSYVEFAERRILPPYSHLPANEIKRRHRREGFEAANADKIFESTYSSQTSRPDN